MRPLDFVCAGTGTLNIEHTFRNLQRLWRQSKLSSASKSYLVVGKQFVIDMGAWGATTLRSRAVAICILLVCITTTITSAKKKRKTSASPLSSVDEQQGCFIIHGDWVAYQTYPQGLRITACGTSTSCQKARPPRALLRCGSARTSTWTHTHPATAPCSLPRKHNAQGLCGADLGVCHAVEPTWL